MLHGFTLRLLRKMIRTPMHKLEYELHGSRGSVNSLHSTSPDQVRGESPLKFNPRSDEESAVHSDAPKLRWFFRHSPECSIYSLVGMIRWTTPGDATVSRVLWALSHLFAEDLFRVPARNSLRKMALRNTHSEFSFPDRARTTPRT